jgi:hypothetical protein
MSAEPLPGSCIALVMYTVLDRERSSDVRKIDFFLTKEFDATSTAQYSTAIRDRRTKARIWAMQRTAPVSWFTK